MVLLAALGAAGADEPAPTRPDDPAARALAKQLRDHGVEAMNRRDFAEASDDFQRAYELFPSPNLLFNLGVALDQEGHVPEALEAFESFVEESAGPEPEALAYARDRVAALSGNVARLQLSMSPADALVTVDARYLRGAHPRGIIVMPGQHVVAGEKPGFANGAICVTLTAGESRPISLSLRPLDKPLAALPPVTAAAATATPPKPRRLYRRWWLWTAAGAVVAGAAIGLGVGLALHRDNSYPPVQF
jgi:tetratricopeptide (TPR) repeat protein